jgi:tRNA threonylcarbamoyl adenosine modification protein YjeE
MKISSIRELGKIADKIKKILSPGDVVFLYGEIGVGKTTFARLLINGFENEKKLKKSEILSPTFNIVFEYEIKEFTIKHFDLYRLKNSNDIKNVGLFENLEQSITLIEWPELIINKPENRFDLFFKYAEDYNERSLIIKTNGRLKKHEF